MAVTLQQILNTAYPAYAATHRLPLRVRQAVSVLRRCRTGALGRNAVKCSAGHALAVRRNSCRHRACPQCGWRRAEQWLERWQARLLPTTHFHVIVTFASQLHPLWRWNRKRFADVFFQATRDALFCLLKEDFQSLWRYRSPYWAGRFLDRWCTRTLRSRIEPMTKIAGSVREHRALILNWFRARGEISAGAVEGLNNKLKLITRRSYGFRSFRVIEVVLSTP